MLRSNHSYIHQCFVFIVHLPKNKQNQCLFKRQIFYEKYQNDYNLFKQTSIQTTQFFYFTIFSTPFI